jgi:diguanylate cyclase (GGDEF)-like protein
MNKFLAIGLDAYLTENLKNRFKKSALNGTISFLNVLEDLQFKEFKNLQGIFFYSNTQSNTLVRKLIYLKIFYPDVPVILFYPRRDPHHVINFFRSGVFDVVLAPFQEHDLSNTLQRLDVRIKSQWNPPSTPLLLSLKFFSQTEGFHEIKDIMDAFIRYLSYFSQVLAARPFELTDTFKRTKKLSKFLNDETGVFFGLDKNGSVYDLLIKFSKSEPFYFQIKLKQKTKMKELLHPYIKNLLRGIRSHIELESKRQTMQSLALTDEVTGLFNQRKLVIDIDNAIANYKIDKKSFSLMFIDIDYFKTVNDQFGHVIGSQLLIDMAEVLSRELRPSDTVYRFGGDEFIVLLPETTLEETKRTALRVSNSIKAQEFHINKEIKYKLSLSIGIAEFPTDAHNSRSIIDFADKMMYMSKKSGRGKVFHVTEVLQ